MCSKLAGVPRRGFAIKLQLKTERKMATITKRKSKKGIRYLAQIRLAGRNPASATFSRKSDAEEWIKVTEADIIRGRYFRHSKAFQHTMAELIDKYRKWHGFKDKKDSYSQGKQLDK